MICRRPHRSTESGRSIDLTGPAVWLGLLSSCVVFATAQQRPDRAVSDATQWFGLLDRMVDLDRLAAAPVPGVETVQTSSYDRASRAGPDDPGRWFANSDRGHFVRVQEVGQSVERVLFDERGPGVVFRIWSANPVGVLRFRFDGEEEPRWEMPFADLLAGRTEGLGEPFAGVRARGHNLYLPIPFRERLMISTDAEDVYYHVGAETGVEEVSVSFDPSWLRVHRDFVATAGERLLALAAGREQSAIEANCERVVGGGVTKQGPGSPGVLWEWSNRGSGVLRRLALQAQCDRPEKHAGLYRSLVVRIDCDSETCVRVPFADFFGSAPSMATWSGVAIGVPHPGVGVCRFPMPVNDSIRIAIEHDGLAAFGTVTLAFRLAFDEVDGPMPDRLHFHASWRQKRDLRTRPFTDFRALNARGPGRLVGLALSVRNPTSVWWGEGDEKVFVDNGEFPRVFGTGTEDYFGYAWSSPERFDHAYHAQPLCEGPGNRGWTSNVRLQVLDPIVFHERIAFDLEVWHWRDVAVDYATTAYWYGPLNGEAVNSLPAAADRLPRPVPPRSMLVVDGAAEGEDLYTQSTGGALEVQELLGDEEITGNRWSRDRQLWWHGASEGDVLTVRLPVPGVAGGVHRLEGALTKAADYGRFLVRCGDVVLREDLDLWHNGVVTTGEFVIGKIEIPFATQFVDVSFEVRGANRRARPGHMLGIDWLRLVAD